MKIAVAGLGYVGLSLAVLLSQAAEVVALDVNAARVDQVNARVSPIEDAEISDYLKGLSADASAAAEPQSVLA